MKKIISSLAILLLVLGVFVSCKNEPDPNPEMVQELNGTWGMYMTKDGESAEEEPKEVFIPVLNMNDGKCTVIINDFEIPGFSASFRGGVLTLKQDVSISESILKVILNEDFEGFMAGIKALPGTVDKLLKEITESENWKESLKSGFVNTMIEGIFSVDITNKLVITTGEEPPMQSSNANPAGSIYGFEWEIEVQDTKHKTKMTFELKENGIRIVNLEVDGVAVSGEITVSFEEGTLTVSGYAELSCDGLVVKLGSKNKPLSVSFDGTKLSATGLSIDASANVMSSLILSEGLMIEKVHVAIDGLEISSETGLKTFVIGSEFQFPCAYGGDQILIAGYLGLERQK